MNSCVDLLSPPAWWCGLKSVSQVPVPQVLVVTTCVVVWIEISDNMFIEPASGVTTCVVVWIEIQRTSRKR